MYLLRQRLSVRPSLFQSSVLGETARCLCIKPDKNKFQKFVEQKWISGKLESILLFKKQIIFYQYIPIFLIALEDVLDNAW